MSDLNDQMAQAKLAFVAEAHELLDAMEEVLLQAESGGCEPESINALFRSAHTIKGSAGLFGLDAIVAFTHTVESVLDRVRAGENALTPELIGVLLECADHIRSLLACDAEAPDATLQAAGQALLARLAPTQAMTSAPVDHTQPDAGEAVAAPELWHVSLRFGPDVFRNGMDPPSFVAYLGELGELVQVVTLADTMPAAAEMDPESCYLGFEITLRSQRTKAEIDAVFDFVRDDCAVRILPPRSRVEDCLRLIRELPEDPLRLGEILVRGGALTAHELERGLREQAAQAQADAASVQPLGEILVQDGRVAPAAVDAALDKQKRAEDKRRAETKFIKVAADRLDGLIDLVGELVIAGATTTAIAARDRHGAMLEATAVLERLVEEIRDAALRMRMVPIGETFARFPRVVRDVARELGKDIELRISGAEAELDKSMVEHLGDPLMHLVRNAIDHGIEPAELRARRGKSPTGVLRLHAYHDSGSIVLEVGDDGGGLDRDRIRAKAIDKGLLAPDAAIGDADLFKLIFEPGFSTAAQVTNLSGRGVGMDVVKRNIEGLRGSIEVDSQPGLGTTIRLRLPLTLAIIDGFLAAVGGAHYIVPLESVVECIEAPSRVDDKDITGYLDLRGEVLPFLDLAGFFGVPPQQGARRSLIVVRTGAVKVGLVVDRLLGEHQTVIKPLGAMFRHLRGIVGSTILGSGEVALILDVVMLVEHAIRTQTPAQCRHEAGAVSTAGIV